MKRGSDIGVAGFDDDERLLAGCSNNRFGARASAGNSVDEALMNYDADSTSAKQKANAVGSRLATIACPLCQKEYSRNTNELEVHLSKVRFFFSANTDNDVGLILGA